MPTILAVLAFCGQLIVLGVKIWDAVKESNEEIKKKKTEALQSGVRAIVDRDASRLVAAFDELRKYKAEHPSVK